MAAAWRVISRSPAAGSGPERKVSVVQHGCDGERQAADLLGIPFDDYTQAGLFPIAYTKGTDFKLAKRLPAEQLTHWDSW